MRGRTLSDLLPGPAYTLYVPRTVLRVGQIPLATLARVLEGTTTLAGLERFTLFVSLDPHMICGAVSLLGLAVHTLVIFKWV